MVSNEELFDTFVSVIIGMESYDTLISNSSCSIYAMDEWKQQHLALTKQSLELREEILRRMK